MHGNHDVDEQFEELLYLHISETINRKLDTRKYNKSKKDGLL